MRAPTLVEIPGHRIDLVQVGVEDRLQAALGPAGDRRDPAVEAGRPARQQDDGDDQDDARDREHDDGDPDVRGDERVEIVQGLLRGGAGRV